MTDEYIKREDAQNVINTWIEQPDEILRAKFIYRDLSAIPAADVAPVVRGRWLTQEYMYGDKSVGIDDAWIERVAEKGECAYCSNCKEYAKLDGNEESALTPYCPNCGAKMDGGQDDA